MRWRDSEKTKGSQDQGDRSGRNLPWCGIIPKLQKNSEEGAQVLTGFVSGAHISGACGLQLDVS